MKVLGIMGSPRVGGNSDILLDDALAGAEKAGAVVEKIILDKKKISGCKDCKKCNETGLCVLKDDMPEIHKKILEADAIIHSVPVYFWSMTAQMKAYLDRWCALFDAEWKWQKQLLSENERQAHRPDHGLRRFKCSHGRPDSAQLQINRGHDRDALARGGHGLRQRQGGHPHG